MGSFTNGFYPYAVGQTISAEADGEDISAGQFVRGTGTSDPSHNDQLTDGELKVKIADEGTATDAETAVGIAMEDIDDGEVGAIAMSGIFLVKCNGSLSAGGDVAVAQSSDGYEVESTTAYYGDGTALTSGSDGNCVLVRLSL